MILFVNMVCPTMALAWFVVRVPVLSEQMTDVQPRVSTEGRDLTGEVHDQGDNVKKYRY
jgi:hypothetical protein